MKVYTGRGDDGQTDLADQSRVSKAHPRIEAYGTVDELNARVGDARPTGHGDVDDRLAAVQNDLFTVQSQLATPDTGEGDPTLAPERTETLEAWIDGHEDEVGGLESFILPAGTEAATRLHVARTACRRAERRTVALADAPDESVAEPVLTYLNRLSDYLFTAARVVNHRDGVDEESPTY
ncbi:MAG: cob(I)yrinic acid a,c-diamide adenosyltransferase [Halobacterium sp.]